MKLQYAHKNVDRTGSLEHRRATIDLNPTVVHVLSRDLYTQPIESTFREVLINALDAHIEVGQTRPVDIYMPTIWDEKFYIRDYGPGLEHTKLMDIYLAYGVSSRRETNDQHGGFGLGTKSPLAYTTSFMVTSYINGTENTYMVYYDEDNMPCVDYRETNPTDEPNGLMVSLVTRNNDYYNFELAAKKILQWIPKNKYNIINQQASKIEVPEDVKLEQHGALVFRQGTGLYVAMGYYRCPIDINAVSEYASSKNIILILEDGESIAFNTILQKLTSSYEVTVEANVGDFPFHPSRERINITPRVVSSLASNFEKGLIALFSNKADSFETDLLKYRLTNSLAKNKKLLKIRARGVCKSEVYWRNDGVVSRLLTTYEDILLQCTKLKEKIFVGLLSANDLTDYLGNNRNYYEYPNNIDNHSTLIFIDIESTSQEVLDLLSKLPLVDVIDDIERYKRKVEEQKKYSFYDTRQPQSPRKVVKSMQDPKHNVLILKSFDYNGGKKDWESCKHNVDSLKELKKEVFWTPTKIGCLKENNEIVRKYFEVEDAIPKWKRPIILGLPASKGTVKIEKEFKSVEKDLEKWIDDFVKSDYYNRRAMINVAADMVNAIIYTKDYAAYGPVSYIRRIEKLAEKYKYFYKQDDTKKYDIENKIAEYINDIEIKFPAIFSWKHSSTKTDEIRLWVEQVAEFTNNKPTGAKAKNDPYYLS